MGSKNVNDHWAFLEEMEAPMWVDLTLEGAHCNTQHDEEWFQTSHLFHQFSSQQLKTAFSLSWEEKIGLDLDGLGRSSPNLPTSVSRSRGKDYRSQEWRRGNCDVSLNKLEHVKGVSGKAVLGSSEKIKPRKMSSKPKSSEVDIGFREEMKPKLSFVSQKGTSSSKSGLITERSSTVKRNSLRQVSIGGSKSSSSSMVDKASESSTASTVTSESGLRPQQKFLATSSRTLDNNMSGLLSAVRITLRKSCVTRQASRVEINSNRRQSTAETYNDRRQSTMQIDNDRRESRNRKSSSSKSSVGSSSLPGSSIKTSGFISMRKKEKTPDSRHVSMITNASNGVKVSKSNVSRVSTVQIKEGSSKRGDIPSVAKLPEKKIAKSKVPNQTLRAKCSVSLRAKDQNSSSTGAIKKAKEKVRFGGLNKSVDGGKENRTGKTSVSQTCRIRENGIGSTIRGQNGTKQNVSQKVDTKRLAGSKGKISYQREGKSSMHVNQSQSVFLR